MNENQTPLDDYLQLRKQTADLETAAKKEMQTRFNALLTEAAQLFTIHKDTFGAKLTTPAAIKSFAINTNVPKKRVATKKTAEAPEPANGNGKKIGRLKRSLETLKAKLASAEAAGTPTQDIEDRIYEVTDQLVQLGVNLTTAAPETPAPTEQETGELVLD